MKHAGGTIYDEGKWIIQLLVQSGKKKGGKKGLQLLLPRGSYLFFGSFIPRFNKVIGKARLRLNLL